MFITARNGRSALERRPALVPIFLAGQILVMHAASGGERRPAHPLGPFPAVFAQWTLFRPDTIDAAVVAELRADRLVSQTYIPFLCEPAGGLVRDPARRNSPAAFA